jgi:hypothetical protein
MPVNRDHDSAARASYLRLEEHINSGHGRVISNLLYSNLGAHKFQASGRYGD